MFLFWSLSDGDHQAQRSLLVRRLLLCLFVPLGWSCFVVPLVFVPDSLLFFLLVLVQTQYAYPVKPKAKFKFPVQTMDLLLPPTIPGRASRDHSTIP